MDISNILILGTLSAGGFIILFLRIGIKKILYFNLAVDIGATFLLGIAFYGTLTGMLTAATGGIIISLFLTVMRKFNNPINPFTGESSNGTS